MVCVRESDWLSLMKPGFTDMSRLPNQQIHKGAALHEALFRSRRFSLRGSQAEYTEKINFQHSFNVYLLNCHKYK